MMAREENPLFRVDKTVFFLSFQCEKGLLPFFSCGDQGLFIARKGPDHVAIAI